MVRKGQRLGQWTVGAVIGGGGNADVWDATSDDGAVVAIKVLRRTDPTSEAYRRFRSEIYALQDVGDVHGVLPLLDAHLPVAPSRDEPAWLAMPMAEPLRTALGDSPPLRLIVEAIAEIGATLTELAGRGVFHRDIKPANLYRLEDTWMIGDFGLVEYPDKEALTASDRRFGPIYFVAPEVLADPSTAEAAPSDVYSLAKTMWVLVTGRKWPLGGEHHIGSPEFSITTFSDDPRARLLDSLLFAATRNEPSHRPTMDEFVSELKRWLSPATQQTPPLDLSELERRFAAYRAPEVAAREFVNARTRLTANAATQLRDLALNEIHTRLDQLMPHPGSYNENSVLDQLGSLVDVQWGTYWASFHVVNGPEGLGQIHLYAAIAAALRDDDRLVIAAGYLIFQSIGREVLWYDERIAIPESAGQDEAVAELARGLYEHLAPAVQGVLQRLDELHAEPGPDDSG